MRFELAVALKYLLPRARQLSTSIISLVSVLVISLVVWLVVVFLSVTFGIEKTWTEELVALNAPLRVIPKDDYYRSYYYLIDSLSEKSNYTLKTLSEKLHSEGDPYDPNFDAEIDGTFPLPDKKSDGTLKDIVKECHDVISSQNLKPQEFEVAFSNLQLEYIHSEKSNNVLNQLCYISTYDNENLRLKKLILTPSSEDLNHLYQIFSQNGAFNSFLQQVDIKELKTPSTGYLVPSSLYPEKGSIEAFGVEREGKLAKIIITPFELELGPAYQKGQLEFIDKLPHFNGLKSENASLYLPGDVIFSAKSVNEGQDLVLSSKIKDLDFHGKASPRNLEIVKAEAKPNLPEAFWVSNASKIPTKNLLGNGILISNAFQKHGVHLGDSGFLSYLAATGSSVREQKIPVYVAGFYNPGVMPIGSRIVYADESLLATLRGQMAVPEDMAPNGFNIYLSNLEEAESLKKKLEEGFKERGIDRYFKVESFADYEFAKPVLEQLKSDKTLFTLIAIIILIVACSNIISMLILLVNDKKKEIGILQSMGVSTKQIASIFGLCGFLTGLISSIVGVLAAIVTLDHLQSLINFLSFLQGREAFQSMFYGKELPNELSVNALAFVLAATALISLLAGIVPAVKACRIRPASILRSE